MQFPFAVQPRQKEVTRRERKPPRLPEFVIRRLPKIIVKEKHIKTPLDVSNEFENNRLMGQHTLEEMIRENLVGTIARTLETERDLDLLLDLRQRDLEILVACLRDWTDQEEK